MGRWHVEVRAGPTVFPVARSLPGAPTVTVQPAAQQPAPALPRMVPRLPPPPFGRVLPQAGAGVVVAGGLVVPPADQDLLMREEDSCSSVPSFFRVDSPPPMSEAESIPDFDELLAQESLEGSVPGLPLPLLSDLDSELGEGVEPGIQGSDLDTSSDLDSEPGAPTVDLSQIRDDGAGRRFMDLFHRLTDLEIQQMAREARALADTPAEAQLEPQQPPPAVASGPPEDQPDGDAEEDQPGEEDADESPLSFVGGVRSTPASPAHTFDIDQRPVLSPDIASDHRVQSILSSGAKTFVPPAGRGRFHVTKHDQVTANAIAALTRHGHLVPGTARNRLRILHYDY